MADNILVAILLNPIVLLSIIFWILAYLVKLFYDKRNKKGMTFMFPFLIMLRTKRLNNWLTRVGQRWPRFWKGFWTVGIVVSFCFTVFGVYFLTSNLFHLILDPQPENYIAPLIPGVTVQIDIFMYLLLPILVNLTIHEFAHAVATTAEGGKLQSTGLMGIGLGILVGFGAFVEPEEAIMLSRHSKKRTKLRIAAAGTFLNAITAGISLLLLLNITTIIDWSYGPHVGRVTTVLSAQQGGYNENTLEKGDVIYAVGGVPINRDTGDDLTSILSNETGTQFSAGQTTNLTVYDPATRQYANKTIYLGPRTFLGVVLEQVNNTAVEVSQVYTVEEGGNNYGRIPAGVVITAINGTAIDYTTNKTIEGFLRGVVPPSQVVLQAANGSQYELRVNYLPKFAGSYYFQDFFLGFLFDINSTGAARVTGLVNVTYGQGDEVLQKGDEIIAVNGQSVVGTSYNFTRLLEEIIQPRPGDVLTFTLDDGRTVSIQVQTIPVIPIFVGYQSEDYWIPDTAIGRLFGGTFPLSFLRQILYFWVIAFSLTLFNMLPFPIFDGDRVVKEFVNGIVGSKFEKGRKQKAKLLLKTDAPDYRFPDFEIEDVHSVTVQHWDRELVEGTDYEIKDTNNSGFPDTISFTPILERQKTQTDLPPKEMLGDGATILVDYDYWTDTKEPIKKPILNAIRIFSAGILFGNFILSIWKLGVVTFWI